MIRINLLPFRAIRKRENIKRQMTVFALIILFLGCAIGYYYIQLNSKLTTLQDEEKRVRNELASYKKTLDQIKELEKVIKEIKAKLDVIKGLEKGKSGPVLLLADISDAVPKGKLWISSLEEKDGSVTLKGTAMDNATVALFMDNLKARDRIGSVDLKSARLRDLPQYRLKVSDFELRCQVAVEKEKSPEQTQVGKSPEQTKKGKP